MFIPKENERDISEFDDAVKEKVHFIAVEDFTDVISGATAH